MKKQAENEMLKQLIKNTGCAFILKGTVLTKDTMLTHLNKK
jgi:hypothetical protein